MSSPETAVPGPAAARDITGDATRTGGHDPKPLSVLVVVPVYNGGALWREAAQAIAGAQRASRRQVRVKVVDSSSRDASAEIAREHGFSVETISSADFDHGRTRNAAVYGDPADVYVFLTQDAILHDAGALDTLVAAFADEKVAVAYGRQLPHLNANPIAAHARTFNYPAASRVAGLEARPRLGIKTVFVSNSFAAYRSTVFHALGGFPKRSIVSEDMYLAARAVLAGHRVAYRAEACVRHSHNYGPLEEFRRYFDIGVFQHDQRWIGETFGAAEGEGMRFVKSELAYLTGQAPFWVPRACLHNALKMLGYRLGRNYPRLPVSLRRLMSMHRGYW